MKKRIVELERANRLLEVDNAGRAQFNAFLEERFDAMFQDFHQTTLELGQKQQEVEQLKALLPPGVGNTASFPFEQVRDAEPPQPDDLGT